GGARGAHRRVLTPGAPDAPAGDADAKIQSAAWTLVPSVTTKDLYGVTGTSATDVVAVGGTPGDTSAGPGVVARWNGSDWSAAPSAINLLAIGGGTAGGELGGEGSETYWNGHAWSAREGLGAGTRRGTWPPSPATYPRAH